MTKEQNNMIIEDFLLDDNIDYCKIANGYFIQLHIKDTKIPDAMLKIIPNEQIINFSIFPCKYVLPLEKISDVAQYFRIINEFSPLGGFELENEKLAVMDIDLPSVGIFPAYNIGCDTIAFDKSQSKDRFRYIISILITSYEKFIDGVLMVEYNILTPVQAAELFLKKE